MKTPLKRLIDILQSLKDEEKTLHGTIAYMLALSAADNLLEDEQRFIESIKNKKDE